MKTLAQVLDGFESQAIDGRDVSRLARFVQEADLPKIGATLKAEFVGKHEATEWTRENILAQLRRDVEFGFEKALDQRGISASCMFEVVLLWNTVLEEGLEDYGREDYAMYGLPLLKATAVKYGWPNPIGDDTGTEDKYQEW